MRNHVPSRLLCLLLLVLAPAVRAQDTAAATSSPAIPAPVADERNLHKINGVFDTDLPATEKKGRVRLVIHPHFGDFTARNYLRVPVGVRWGAAENLELTAMAEAYFAHGLRSGRPGNGLGDVQFGAKYAFPQWLKPDYDASIGVNLRFPVGSPPIDLTDGHDHYAPYLVIGKKSQRTVGLTYFASTTLDILEKSSVRGIFRKNDPRSTNLQFTSGFVLDRYPYHYTLEAGFQTTTLVGSGNDLFVFVKPGFAWDLPRRLTFSSRSHWLLGASVKITVGPDGTRIDSGGKIRGEFSLRRMFGTKKTEPVASAP